MKSMIQYFDYLRLRSCLHRIFMGKNKVARAAFGKTPAEEMREGLSEAGKRLTGNRGLLFTNTAGREVIK